MVVDWQTVVDGGGTRELWNGRAVWHPRIRDRREKSSNAEAEQHQEYCWKRSSTSISAMEEAEMRADMGALMARLVQTQTAFDGYSTTSRSCSEDHSTTRRHLND